MRTRWAVLATLAVLGTAGAEAQEVDADSRARTLRGRVVDVETGFGLYGAFVAPQGSLTGFLTDSLGNFALTLPATNLYTLTAEQLGYETVALDVSYADADRPVEIRLRPDPILLEGVGVLADRFHRRRQFFSGSIRVYDRERLLRSPGMNALDFVSSRTGMVRPCRGDPLNFCVWRRGRLRPMSLCIDERLSFMGARELEHYAPQDFYLVEVYDWGSQVRVYTNGYVERTVNRGSPLRPLVMGC